MSPGAIVEADIAKTETTNELLFKVGLVVVGEVETVFSGRQDAIGADGAHENSDDVEISIYLLFKPSKSQNIYSSYSF